MTPTLTPSASPTETPTATPTLTATATPIQECGLSVSMIRTGDEPRLAGDPVDFQVTIQNTGETTIIELPLRDLYDPDILSFTGAEPGADDAVDDGQIDWSDLTTELGSLLPGESHTAQVHFVLAMSASGLDVPNAAQVPDARDENGNYCGDLEETSFVLDCTDLEVAVGDITFDPEQASPGDLVTITVEVSNIGEYETDAGRMVVAFETTPLDPEDDPNLQVIDQVDFGPLSAGSSHQLQVVWDTTGVPAVGIPIFVWLEQIVPPECVETNNSAVAIYTVPIVLSSFSALSGDAQVQLQWVTETEIELFGWRVFRSEDYHQGYQRIDQGLIPGHGTSFVRHEYSLVDQEVVNGQIYFYHLESVDFSGGSEQHPIVAANPGPEAQDAPSFRLEADRARYHPEDHLRLRVAVQNGARDRSVLAGLWIATPGGSLETLLPLTEALIPAGYAGEGLLLDHELRGNEPVGEYVLFGILADPASGSVLSMGTAAFRVEERRSS